MTLRGTAENIETRLYTIKDSNQEKVFDKIWHGDLDNPPMQKAVATIQASKQIKNIDIPRILGPFDVPIIIRIYVPGEKSVAILNSYDIVELVKTELETDMLFNNSCTSSSFPEEPVLYGEGDIDNVLLAVAQITLISNYSNNE